MDRSLLLAMGVAWRGFLIWIALCVAAYLYFATVSHNLGKGGLEYWTFNARWADLMLVDVEGSLRWLAGFLAVGWTLSIELRARQAAAEQAADE